MRRQTRGKGAMSSRWAIGCFPYRTASTSEDGEVICNGKKSQEYRRIVLPESRIIVVCPFVRRGGRDRGQWNLPASEIVIVDRGGNPDQPFEPVRNETTQDAGQKWSARNHWPLLENWPLMVRAKWKATFIYRCVPAVNFRAVDGAIN